MKILASIFLFLPLLFQAQKNSLSYGFQLNTGLERLYPENNLDVESKQRVGYYLNIGLTRKIDSTFLVYCGLRYGRENNRFVIHPGNSDHYYRIANRSLSFILSPGIRINRRQSFFFNFIVARVLQAHGADGGGGGERNGRTYSYQYVSNLPQNSWEFRPGVKWQIRPAPAKKLALELGVEPCLLTRKVEMPVKNTNPNLSPAVYRLRYDLILFYTGISF